MCAYLSYMCASKNGPMIAGDSAPPAIIRTSAKEEDDDMDDPADAPKEEPEHDEDAGDGDAGDGGGPSSAESALLSDWQYKFDSALRQSSRNLIVKDLMILFDNSTIYGKRTAFHKALLITASGPH